MKKIVEIEMIQGFTKNGDLITHVSKAHEYMKYKSFPTVPVGHIVRPIAKFKIKYPLPKKKFLESNYTEKIENLFYHNLAIHQSHV